MAIVYLFLTLFTLILVLVISNKVLARHRLYGRVPMPTAVPKTFLVLTAAAFAIACVWQFALDTIHEMESPDFWISAFSADPILGEVFSTAKEYDMDLGIPGAELRPNDLLMVQNVSETISIALWCAVAGVAVYAGYVAGLLRESRPMLIASLVLFAIILTVGGRSAVLGMIHLSDWVFAGMGNDYDGDISDSATLQPLTVSIAVIAAIGMMRGITKVNIFMKQAAPTAGRAAAHATVNQQRPQPEQREEEGQTAEDASPDEGKSKAEKLMELKRLMDSGAISEEEFTSMKREILNS